MASSNMNDSDVYHNCAHSSSKFGQVAIYDHKDSLSSKTDLKPEWFQPKDASKRKRVNRIAKLKQCKLDARREQWLSQGSPSQTKVVDKHRYDVFTHRGNSGRSSVLLKKQVLNCGSECEESIQTLRIVPNVHAGEDGGKHCSASSSSGLRGSHVNEETPLRRNTANGLQVPGMNGAGNNRIAKGCGSETVQLGNESILEVHGMTRMHKGCLPEERNASSFGIHVQSTTRPDVKEGGENLAKEGHRGLDISLRDIPEIIVNSVHEQQKQGSMSVSPSNGINSVHLLRKNSMGNGFSGDLSRGNGYHDKEDDWEAVADAIHVQVPKSGGTSARVPEIGDTGDLLERAVKLSDTLGLPSAVLNSQYKYNTGGFARKTKGMGGRAWRPDDAARPPSLPSLSEQHSFPHISSPATWRELRESNWGPPSAPLSCPICTEDLDVTDSSFVPCSCGFRLCLFCHHRIALDDGRCPGCRKAYNSDAAMKVSHTSSIWLHI